jgi:peptide/histidine transporter 3/4
LPFQIAVLTPALALGAEFTEGICFFGIQKNLVTFLTSVLHESNVDAARNISTWIGTCFFTPLIGAFLADTYWGRYWTTVTFLTVYTVVSFLFIKYG